MKDSETLRAIYNERFKNPKNRWGSENIKYCLKVTKQIANWLKLKKYSNYRVLDVGCATGYYTKAFSLLGMSATGLDYSDVAIERARRNHSDCQFIHMDGLNPTLTDRYDLIFCKGFSGTNTHDLDFVAGWSNRYIDHLNPGGFLVLSYSSNFSGQEIGEETVNWTIQEINKFGTMINAEYKGFRIYYPLGFISYCYNLFLKLLGKQRKLYFYMLFKKRP